jgi:hypothetical protein
MNIFSGTASSGLQEIILNADRKPLPRARMNLYMQRQQQQEEQRQQKQHQQQYKDR